MVQLEFVTDSCGTLLVKTSISIGTGKSYLEKDED